MIRPGDNPAMIQQQRSNNAKQTRDYKVFLARSGPAAEIPAGIEQNSGPDVFHVKHIAHNQVQPHGIVSRGTLSSAI